MKGTRLWCVAALVISGTLAHAVTPSFHGVGISPPGYGHESHGSWCYGVSPDGSTAVGKFRGPRDYPFRWTPSDGMVMLDLPGEMTSGEALGASENGVFIAGSGGYGGLGYAHAARWPSAGGVLDLGDLADGQSQSGATGISSDGTVVVGFSDVIAYPEAFRWTADTGMVSLGDLPGGITYSTALGVSGDGCVVVGIGHSGDGSIAEAFRWAEETGMIGLGFLPGGTNNHSLAWGTSEDGSVVVGYSIRRIGYNDYKEAFVWTEEEGMVGLGILGRIPSTVGGSEARAVSGDGSVVVGNSSTDEEGAAPFVWDADTGMRALADVLQDDCGLDLAGWDLESALGISHDGLTIVGTGYDPRGQWEGWIATIPEPATLSLLALGGLAVIRRRRK